MNRLYMAKSLQDRQTLDRKTPALWLNLCTAIGTKVKEFNTNSGPGCKLLLTAKLPAFTLARIGRKALAVGNLNDDRIAISGKNGLRLEEEWRVKVTVDGLDVWLFDGENCPAELDAFAENLIERLLEQTDCE